MDDTRNNKKKKIQIILHMILANQKLSLILYEDASKEEVNNEMSLILYEERRKEGKKKTRGTLQLTKDRKESQITDFQID